MSPRIVPQTEMLHCLHCRDNKTHTPTGPSLSASLSEHFICQNCGFRSHFGSRVLGRHSFTLLMVQQAATLLTFAAGLFGTGLHYIHEVSFSTKEAAYLCELASRLVPADIADCKRE